MEQVIQKQEMDQSHVTFVVFYQFARVSGPIGLRCGFVGFLTAILLLLGVFRTGNIKARRVS